MQDDMKQAIDEYMAYLAKNYQDCQGDYSSAETNAKMLADFKAGLRVTYGEKYAKVVTHATSAHTFVVLVDGTGHPRGTMLMPANWSTPSKKHARGNVLTREYSGAKWNGLRYMR